MSNANRNRNSNRRRRQKKKSFLPKLRRQYEFRPDVQKISWLKIFHLTNLQRRGLLKWSLYSLVCIAALLIQDVIMSRFHFFGGTTDLVVCAIMLITVIEGIDNGSIFVLLSSLVYFFSGSAPGAFAVAMLTIYGIGAAIFRQAYWHRNRRSIVLCAAIALMAYELSVFGAGLFLELTHFGRVGAFLVTGLLSCVLLLPLYPLIDRIGRIGGTEWKE
jgi:hypothetical protein